MKEQAVLSHEQGAAPPATGAPATQAARRFIIKGGFRLLVSDASCRSGQRTVATSGPGDAKLGVLVISEEAITFEQKLSFAGVILLFLLGLLPAWLLGLAARHLLSSLFNFGPRGAPGIVVPLMLLLAPLLPLWVARRTRKSLGRFPMRAVAGARVRGPEVELDFGEAVKGREERPGANVVPEAVPKPGGPVEEGAPDAARPAPEPHGAPPALGTTVAWAQQLVVRPERRVPFEDDPMRARQNERLIEMCRASAGRLGAALSAAGIRVDDFVPKEEIAAREERAAEQKEQAEFNQRLGAATPERAPWTNLVIIGLNALLIVCLLDPAPSQMALVSWGANWGPLTTTGEWWRLLTCCFLHWNIGHLLGNMCALLIWGLLAERLFGKGFFLAIYLGCSLASSLASLCWNPTVISAGASGAVFGVCGALLGYLARESGEVPESVLGPLLRGGAIFVVFNLFQGLAKSGIDGAAHVGGLFAGLLFGCAAARPLKLKSRKALAGRTVVQFAVCVGVVLGGLFACAPRTHPDYGPALYRFASAYWSGKAVAKDEAAAVKFFRKAAEQGHDTAQYDLGWCYENGRGVKRNDAEAVGWYRKAAEQDNALAQNNLGVCYENGQGVQRDYAAAVEWYRKAAEQGNAHGQANLGQCYQKGRGVQTNYAEAVNWLRSAAEQGDAFAQNNLGVCCENGQGVEKDLAEAVKWYRKAADQGNAFAQDALKRLPP